MVKKVFLIILVNISLFGAPAFHGDREFKQSDSEVFKGKLQGDEWFSWVETEDGYTAKYNAKSKNYEYMILDSDEKLIFSDVKVQRASNRAPSLNQTSLPSSITKISFEKLGEIWKKEFDKKRRAPLLK